MSEKPPEFIPMTRPAIDEATIQGVCEVLRSGWITSGPQVKAFEAALSAGHTRIRPVLMTAAAMIVGMIPMAIGGAGEEQNAALARAVIGGLLFATPTTLLIVPYLFAMLRKGNDGKPAQGVFAEDPV